VAEEIFCTPVTRGDEVASQQAVLWVRARILSALYLALPQRLPPPLLPRLIAAERFPVRICFDYGIYPEDEVNGFSFGAAVFFCTSSFGVQRLRSHTAAKRFRLARGYGNRAKRGFILPTEALKPFRNSTV
jgi:hypothetical protein